LNLGGNLIGDISAVSGLTNLIDLWLDTNYIFERANPLLSAFKHPHTHQIRMQVKLGFVQIPQLVIGIWGSGKYLGTEKGEDAEGDQDKKDDEDEDS